MDAKERKGIDQTRLPYYEKAAHDRLKSEFFANLSHEFNTPINAIYSALQLEDTFIKENNMEGIKKYNEIMKNNCFRLLRTCSNLLDITEIDSGFLKPKNRKHNIVELVEETVASAAPYILRKQMQVVFDTDTEEKYVLCDSELIERIILNLLSNSIKYGKSGGHIDVFLCDRGHFVEISIKDDGIGIPLDKQDSVFERFMQADRSLTRNSEGSGIGLSLVKSMVELHGGSISLVSREDAGTEFLIRLPACGTEDEYHIISDESPWADKIIERTSIEFSDIYFE